MGISVVTIMQLDKGLGEFPPTETSIGTDTAGRGREGGLQNTGAGVDADASEAENKYVFPPLWHQRAFRMPR